MRDFCLNHQKFDWLNALQYCGDSVTKQIIFLLNTLGKEFSILLLFDNVESFQETAQINYVDSYVGKLIQKFKLDKYHRL